MMMMMKKRISANFGYFASLGLVDFLLLKLALRMASHTRYVVLSGVSSIFFERIALRHLSDSEVVKLCCSQLSRLDKNEVSLKILVHQLIAAPCILNSIQFVEMLISNAAYTNRMSILKLVLPIVEKQSPSLGLYIRALLAKDQGYNLAALFYQNMRRTVNSELHSKLRAQEAVTNKILTELAGISTNVKPATFISSCEEKLPLQRLATLDLRANGAYVVVVSCDDKMFEIYGDWFIRNYKANNSKTLHFHISITESNIEASKEKLRHILSQVNFINCTYDVINPEERAWSSLSRLVLAAELMECYSANIVVMDLDCLPYFDIDAIVNVICANDIDMGACCSQTLFPWVQINANLVVFTQTDNVKYFLRILSEYIIEVISEGMYWTLDQAALYQVFQYVQERGRRISCLDLSDFVDRHRLVHSGISLDMMKEKMKHKNKMVSGVEFIPGRICALR